jgi:hypothetical protein
MKQLNAKGNPIYYENFGVDGKLKNKEAGLNTGTARIIQNMTPLEEIYPAISIKNQG